VTPLATGKANSGVGDGEAAFDGRALAVVLEVEEVWPHPASKTTRRATPRERGPFRTMANDKAKRSSVTSLSRSRHNSVEDGRQQQEA
jgi:hypothetical protein